MKNEDVIWSLENLESRIKSLSNASFFKIKTFISDEFFPQLFEVKDFKSFYESKIFLEFPALVWTDKVFLLILKTKGTDLFKLLNPCLRRDDKGESKQFEL